MLQLPPQAWHLCARLGTREVWESNLSNFADSGELNHVFLSQPQSNNKNSLVSPAQEPAPLQTAMVPLTTASPPLNPGCLLPLSYLLFLSYLPRTPQLLSFSSHRADCSVCCPAGPLPFILLLGNVPSCMAEPLLLLLLLLGERVIRAAS